MEDSFKFFPKDELVSRWSKAKKLMLEQNLDALLITEEHNYIYFTGGINWTNYPPAETCARPGIVIIPSEGNPVSVVAGTDVDGAKLTGWVEDVIPYNHLPFAVEGRGKVKEALEGLGLAENKVIGCELGEEKRLGLPFNDFQWLKEQMPTTKFTDGTPIINQMRAVKSPLEVDRLRKICAIQSIALEKAFSEMREKDVTGYDITKIIFKHLLAEGADRPGFVIQPGAPDNIGNPLWKPTIGDFFCVDVSAVRKGYWSDFTRMLSVGKPSTEILDWHDWHWQAIDKCMAPIKPGVPIAEIARVCDEEYTKRGLPGMDSYLAGRIGHSVGLSNGEPPGILLNNKTLLEEGMVLAIEPCGFTIPGSAPRPTESFLVGFIHGEEQLVVTSNGYELLSTTPREMFVI